MNNERQSGVVISQDVKHAQIMVTINKENYEIIHQSVLPMINYRAYYFAQQWKMDFDDVKSLLDIALLECIDDYDEVIGQLEHCTFSTFFWNKMSIVLLDQSAKLRKTPNSYGRRSSEPDIAYMGDLVASASGNSEDDDDNNSLEDYLQYGFVNEDEVPTIVHNMDLITKLLELANEKTKQDIINLYELEKEGRCGEATLTGLAKLAGTTSCAILNRFKVLRKDFEEKYGPIEECI